MASERVAAGLKPLIIKVGSATMTKVPGVEIDPERQSGVPVFAGTRMPVEVVTDNIPNGGTKAEIAEIMENFDVTPDQVNLVLRELRRRSHPPHAGARP
jgi:uncharacterized protein (DUF433 family)